MRPIDADSLYEVFKANPEGYFNSGEVAQTIDHEPTLDVMPVVHAYWEWWQETSGNPLDGYDVSECGFRCSECKGELPDPNGTVEFYDYPTVKFCPECAARMDAYAPGREMVDGEVT